jgi:peptidase C39-like protein
VTTRRWLTRRNLTVLGLATAGFLAAVAGPASAAHAADAPPPALELAHDFQIQENGYYCGPSATRVALSAQGKVLTQDQVAQKLGTTPNGTDSINQVTDALNGELGAGRYHSVTIPGPKASPEQVAQLKADVVTSLSAGKPIVANIAGTVTDEDGQVHAYQGGHYLPVIGYAGNGETVRIADSWDKDGNAHYTITADQLANWTATRGYSA